MSTPTRDNHISYELHGHTALIGIDRPEKRNAMSQDMFEALGRAARKAQDEARVAILFSHGPNFSAGLDLAEQFERDPVSSMHISRAQHEILNIVEQGRIPFIAALQGATIGAGLEIAAAAHVRVADETTFFALPEGRRGIFVGGGGSVRIARLTGVARMMEMMLTARTVSVEEGLASSLTQFITPAGEALTKSLELADSIAKNAPLSNYAIINGLPRIRESAHDDGLFFESVLTAMTMTTADSKAGLSQFLQKKADRLTP